MHVLMQVLDIIEVINNIDKNYKLLKYNTVSLKIHTVYSERAMLFLHLKRNSFSSLVQNVYL